MKSQWTDIAIVVALMSAGCIAIYAGLVKALRGVVAEQQEEAHREIRVLTARITELQTRVSELSTAKVLSESAPPENADAIQGLIHGTAEMVAGEEASHPKAETVAVITAASTAFLDRKVRIRSVRAIATAQDAAGAWAQQGRVLVQASHNLRN